MIFNQKKIILILTFLFLASCTSPEKVENLGIFGKSRLADVAGQDGCTPVPIDKRYVLWTFGDTLFGEWKGDVTASMTFENSARFKGMISNSLAFTEYPDNEKIGDLTFKFLKKKGKVTSFIDPKKRNDGAYYKIWAIDGIKIKERLYLYYIIVKMQKRKGVLPFTVFGTGLAYWDIPAGWKPGDRVNFRKIGRIFRENEPVFGDSVILKDGYLYLIGHGSSGKKVNGYFARVRPAGIEKRENYSFLKKDGSWSQKLKDAHGYFGEVFGEPSLSYNEFLKKYLVIFCGSGGWINLAAFRDFSRLEKIQPATVYLPDKLPEIKTRIFYIYYSGKEIFSTEKNIYAIYINPAIYQPILLRIPYSFINKITFY